MQNKIFRLFRASDLAFGGLNSRYVYACKWAEIEEGRAGGWGLDERRMPISFLTLSVSLMEVKLSYEPVRSSVSVDLMVSRSYDLYQLSGERIMGHPVVDGIRPLP